MDVERILETLQSHNLIRLNKPSGKYYSIYCPFHNNGNERRASCGVLLEDEWRNGKRYPQGLVHCFTCHYAKTLPDMVSDLLKQKNISKSGLDWLVENVPGFDGSTTEFKFLIPQDLMKQINNQYALDSINQILNQSKPEYISEKELASYRFCVDYMYQRGLTDEIIVKYDIGVDMNYIPPRRKNPVPCITFPVRDIKGNTLFICRRSIEGKAFYLPSNVVKVVYGLYELPNDCTRVIITESCFNTLTAVKYGVPSVSLLGTGTEYQIAQLKNLGVQEFILGLDPDEAGDRGSKKLKNKLRDVAIVRRMVDIPNGKDINDLTYDEFMQAYESRI